MVCEQNNRQASMRERPTPSGALNLVSVMSPRANLSAEPSIGLGGHVRRRIAVVTPLKFSALVSVDEHGVITMMPYSQFSTVCTRIARRIEVCTAACRALSTPELEAGQYTIQGASGLYLDAGDFRGLRGHDGTRHMRMPVSH